jgi:putative flavoprotein involved in K+ transport
MDIWWWLERIGRFDKTIDEVPDAEQARSEGSIQLVGRPDHRDVDVATLQRLGVRLAGRLRRVAGSRVEFASDLAATTAASDGRLLHTLAAIDRHIVTAGLEAEVTAPEHPAPLRDTAGLDHVDLTRAGITAVVWATGFRRSYPWLDVPVLDGAGEIRHRRGITPVPGLYVLGQRFQHRRDSNFIDGVRHDAAYVADHIAGGRTRRRRDGSAPLGSTVTSA